jgi:uncharacterized protein (TIGR02611 family)
MKVISAVRKVAIALVGFPLLAFGVVLIPLPGPGIVVCLVALFILSFEFDWAAKYRDKLRQEVKNIWNAAQKRARDFEDKADKSRKR